ATGTHLRPSLVLLAYAAANIIALVPITPGGLGVVEASLGGLLILAGVRGGDAFLATLAYRLRSYLLPRAPAPPGHPLLRPPARGPAGLPARPPPVGRPSPKPRQDTPLAGGPTATPWGGVGRPPPNSAGGGGNPAAGVPATRSWCTGRKASRRAARSAPSSRTSSTSCPPSWTRSAFSRPPRSGASPNHPSTASASPTPSTTRPQPPGTAPSTTRCSPTGPSTTTGGGRCARGPGRRSPRRASHSARRSPRRRAPTWTPTTGSCTTSPPTQPKTTTSPAPTGQAHRADRHVVGRSREIQRAPGRRQRQRADPGRAPPRSPSRGPGAPTGPAPRRWGSSPRRACSTGARLHRRGRDPARRSEGVLICQGSRRGCWSYYVKDGRLCYAHNYPSRAIYQVSSSATPPAGRHQLRFGFEPTAAPDIPRGKGSPGRAQLYLDGQLIAQNQFPVTTPIGFNPGGLTCGANPGSAITTDCTAPFRFTGTLHTVTVDLSGDLI